MIEAINLQDSATNKLQHQALQAHQAHQPLQPKAQSLTQKVKCETFLKTWKGKFLVSSLAICCLFPAIFLPIYLRPKFKVLDTQNIQLAKYQQINQTLVNVNEKFLIKDNINVDLTYTMAGKIQSDNNTDIKYTGIGCLSYNHQGIGVKDCGNGIEVLLDFSKIEGELIHRILAQTQPGSQPHEEISRDEFIKQLIKEMNNSTDLNFSYVGAQSFVELIYNGSNKLFEPNQGQSRPIRKLFFSSILSKVAQAIKKTVTQVVNVIKVHGASIGKVAGGIIGGSIGFAVAGPAGLIPGATKGANIGEKVGIAAQFVANSCFPNPPKLNCNMQSAKEAAVVAIPKIVYSSSLDIFKIGKK